MTGQPDCEPRWLSEDPYYGEDMADCEVTPDNRPPREE